MGPALWLFVLTVNLAPQTHVPKLPSLPHASLTNVTFMSSFAQNQTPPLPPPHTHTHTHTSRLLASLITLCRPTTAFNAHTQTHRLSANRFHILREELFLAPLFPVFHYQGYISCSERSCVRTARNLLMPLIHVCFHARIMKKHYKRLLGMLEFSISVAFCYLLAVDSGITGFTYHIFTFSEDTMMLGCCYAITNIVLT